VFLSDAGMCERSNRRRLGMMIRKRGDPELASQNRCARIDMNRGCLKIAIKLSTICQRNRPEANDIALE